MKPILLNVCLAVFVSSTCLAQQANREARKIDRVVNQQMVANTIPGVSLAVLRKGKIVLLKSYGLANVEHRVPVTPSTVFQSGSIGKQFTAAAVMILVQENKLSLDAATGFGVRPDSTTVRQRITDSDGTSASITDTGWPFTAAPGRGSRHSSCAFSIRI